GLYLFAYVEEYDQIRTFAVERIESIEKTREEFEKPEDFSVESYLESAFGVVKEDPFDVEIIFNADIAEYVRSRVWHPSQQVREIGGGRINMKLHVGGEFELGSWILSFGPSAVVVSPERLRRREEPNLRHVTINLGREADRSRIIPILTTKHSLEYCLEFAQRAHSLGFSSLVVLGGDKSDKEPRCVEHAYELRSLIRKAVPGLT